MFAFSSLPLPGHISCLLYSPERGHSRGQWVSTATLLLFNDVNCVFFLFFSHKQDSCFCFFFAFAYSYINIICYEDSNTKIEKHILWGLCWLDKTIGHMCTSSVVVSGGVEVYEVCFWCCTICGTFFCYAFFNLQDIYIWELKLKDLNKAVKSIRIHFEHNIKFNNI